LIGGKGENKINVSMEITTPIWRINWKKEKGIWGGQRGKEREGVNM